jgi:hypothetical protein
MVVNKFHDLTDAEKVETLRGLSLAAFLLGVESWSVLAKRGLISSDEAEVAFAPVLELYDRLPAKLHDAMPYEFTEGLAEIKRVAAANWKGA